MLYIKSQISFCVHNYGTFCLQHFSKHGAWKTPSYVQISSHQDFYFVLSFCLSIVSLPPNPPKYLTWLSFLTSLLSFSYPIFKNQIPQNNAPFYFRYPFPKPHHSSARPIYLFTPCSVRTQLDTLWEGGRRVRSS